MSEEEMNRKMEFIVEQQAQFVVDIHKLNEGQRELQDAQKELHAAQTEITVKHNHLTDALTTVVGMVGKLAQGQQELREAQNETNERLNIFIDVLERYISGQQGKSG